MDIGRTVLSNTKALQRLDAGTFGTMGVGFGFAIAAQALHKDKKVVMVVGDSAFGFSGMEVETASRYNLPLKIIIINNNGISMGGETKSKDDNALNLPVTHLNPLSAYEQISIAFGGKGREVKTHQELEQTLTECLADNNLWVVNVRIDPSAGRKAQQFAWLTREEEKAPKL
jgi:2-hydroxyacyl-CoA lyase 1